MMREKELVKKLCQLATLLDYQDDDNEGAVCHDSPKAIKKIFGFDIERVVVTKKKKGQKYAKGILGHDLEYKPLSKCVGISSDIMMYYKKVR